MSVTVIRGRALAAGVDRGPTAVAHVAAVVVAAGAEARATVRVGARAAATRATAKHAVHHPLVHIPESAPRAEVRANLALEARVRLPRRQLLKSKKTGTNRNRKGRKIEGNVDSYHGCSVDGCSIYQSTLAKGKPPVIVNACTGGTLENIYSWFPRECK